MKDHRGYDGATVTVLTPAAGLATIKVASESDYVMARLDSDTARDVGTYILRCAGNPGLNGTHAWNNVQVTAVDGEVSIGVSDNGAYAEHGLRQPDAVDVGQRLIVWAGIDMRQVGAHLQ